MKQTLAKFRAAVADRMPGSSVAGAYKVAVGTRARLISYRWVLAIFGVFVLYNALWVSSRYVTVTSVYVKSTNENTSILPTIPLVPGGLGGASQDALLLRNYIHSADMLTALDTKLDLRSHYSSRDWDYFSRMANGIPEEGFLGFFREHLSVSIEAESNILTIRSQAFNPEFSQLIADEVLQQAEAYINGVSQKIALQEIAFVERELDRAREAVSQTRGAVLAFQTENELLDPVATGAAVQEVVNIMEGELVRLEAEEKVLTSYLQGDAAELVSVRDRINGIRTQLEQERNKFAGQGSQSINQVNARFEELRQSFEFATDIYKGTLQTLEQARVESYRKLKHLVVVQSPQIPDSAILPRKFYNLVTLFVILNLIYGIAAMVIATIREHRDV